jgi:hypothetical protein
MHFADNRNRPPLNPAQLKQCRQFCSLSGVGGILSRADDISSRAIPDWPDEDALGLITLKPVLRLRPRHLGLGSPALNTAFFFFLV